MVGCVSAIIQARMGSSRLPGKSLRTLGSVPVLAHVISRTRAARLVDRTIVATSVSNADDPIAEFCERIGVPVFRGSEKDVLDRYACAAEAFELLNVVRITGDNPLVGSDVIDFMVEQHFKDESAFTSSYHSRSFSNGTIVSVLSTGVLKYLSKNVFDPEVREHIVTGYPYLKDKFRCNIVVAPPEWSRYDLRYCLDHKEDWDMLEAFINELSPLNRNPTTSEIIEFLDTHANIKRLNEVHARLGY
jgi:spore coat polysaccharide biosynthesis protein SpsF